MSWSMAVQRAKAEKRDAERRLIQQARAMLDKALREVSAVVNGIPIANYQAIQCCRALVAFYRAPEAVMA